MRGEERYELKSGREILAEGKKVAFDEECQEIEDWGRSGVNSYHDEIVCPSSIAIICL